MYYLLSFHSPASTKSKSKKKNKNKESLEKDLDDQVKTKTSIVVGEVPTIQKASDEKLTTKTVDQEQKKKEKDQNETEVDDLKFSSKGSLTNIISFVWSKSVTSNILFVKDLRLTIFFFILSFFQSVNQTERGERSMLSSKNLLLLIARRKSCYSKIVSSLLCIKKVYIS